MPDLDILGLFVGPHASEAVKQYRAIAQSRGIPLTEDITDDLIWIVHSHVQKRFNAIAEKRNEAPLSERSQQFITFKLLIVHEKAGYDFMMDHLKYEASFYRDHGLRPEYVAGLVVPPEEKTTTGAPTRKRGLFGFFAKQREPALLDDFIVAMYGKNPPPKTAVVGTACDLAYDDLLMKIIGRSEVEKLTAELYKGPIPYSTHDLAVSVAMNFFRRPELASQLAGVQLAARKKAAAWAGQRYVVQPLLWSFEQSLQDRYDSNH